MIPKYARYEYCINKATEFILNENINKFPFDCDDIIRNKKWSRLKYESLASKLNVSIDDIIDAYGSEDGYSIYNGRNYSIAYNNTHIPKRIYFTKLHEIGHIYLNHFIDFDETIITRSNLSENNYKVLENEANCFARNVIAPAVVVKHLNLDTPTKISTYFGITNSAAKTRLDLLNLDYKYISKYDENNLLSLFEKNMYKNFCPNCLHDFISKTSKYCPICGDNKLILGDGNMKYDSIELYENSKAKICPICENELTNIEGSYCQICGTHIINKCTNDFCDSLLSGESRYCSHCGSKSTFYQNGLLNDWEEIKAKDIDEFEFPDIYSTPVINNDDMPF
ncbi:ImmA/IrrE family metallo-endopeptidase [Clostridium sp.]|uniref:ImmA/IrrE family metallo-endopeptidase n=1 Tax=Clostridium sp. TaxID=1506 RepID=UPI00290F4A0B|nr:ImmA/IrrE family metallo-endopeptidase [Clostridium sp.]MDU7365380.1 ImmA/IrrE family metallo-endopeptidase [Clostridium sp.]